MPGIECLDSLRRPHAASCRETADIVGFAREQRGVEISPEPGNEEHHLRGDEQDHPVAMRYLNDPRVKALVLGLADDVTPPDDKCVEHAEHTDAEYERRRR